MEQQSFTKLLGTITDKTPKFITKKWIDVHNQFGNANDRCKPSKKIRLKTSVLQPNLCNYSDGDAYIVVEGTITVIDPMHMIRNELLKVMHHLFAA